MYKGGLVAVFGVVVVVVVEEDEEEEEERGGGGGDGGGGGGVCVTPSVSRYCSNEGGPADRDKA